ncbi:hypothetical protein EMCRGX_G028412 [Ephydatia muelleri]
MAHPEVRRERDKANETEKPRHERRCVCLVPPQFLPQNNRRISSTERATQGVVSRSGRKCAYAAEDGREERKGSEGTENERTATSAQSSEERKVEGKMDRVEDREEKPVSNTVDKRREFAAHNRQASSALILANGLSFRYDQIEDLVFQEIVDRTLNEVTSWLESMTINEVEIAHIKALLLFNSEASILNPDSRALIQHYQDQIMLSLNSYLQLIRETEPACNQVDYFSNILIGGDQLTVKNANGYCQTLTVERDP